MSGNVVPFTAKGRALASRSDDELRLLSSGGALAGFEELVRRHARRVVGFCGKHLGDRQAGEEFAQEIWLSVWDHRKEYQPEGKFVVWLFTLARNRILLAYLLAFAIVEGDARADERATSFALIVTNNHTVRLSRPDLRDADDDGAKFYERFRILMPESNLALLTTFDRDTEKLFPDVAGGRTPQKGGRLVDA